MKKRPILHVNADSIDEQYLYGIAKHPSERFVPACKKMDLQGMTERVKLYISVQNLLTFTKYTGMDHKVNYCGGGNSVNLGLIILPIRMRKA